jgi:hypothetical protein
MTLETLMVTRIEPQGDRVLLYGAAPAYHVIAGARESADLTVGDTIAYEPYGLNFGWFVRRVEPPASRLPLEEGPWMRDEEDQLRDWLASFPPRWAVTPGPMPASVQITRETLFEGVLDALDVLKAMFGYEAVYFGIGCKAFPEAPSQEQA